MTILKNIRDKAVLNGKNILGWRTDRKIVVFAVDDYGNVRLDSKEARDRLSRSGIPLNNRFDQYDALETRQDLDMLYEVLQSARDKNGRHAVITPYALPCNIDFQQVQKNVDGYYFELLPQSFQKKEAIDPQNYSGAWELWKEGINEGLMAPQFHGREHLNLKIFEEKLAQQDPELLVQLKNRSLTHIADYRNKVSALAAFDFWEPEENNRFKQIIEDGLNKFETVFGYRAQNFTPPGYCAHPMLYDTLKENGIRFIDTALIAHQHQGRGRYKRQFNYTGKKEKGLCKMVRNVVFEPTDDRGVDWPAYTMQQIEAAFRWKRPVIISSHRVNFCGHIDPQNRVEGLAALKKLLTGITQRWPDVEFMSANGLGKLVETE